jgi:hypothetical protein
MRPGPRPTTPRLRLNPQFRNHILDAMTQGQRSWILALICGFPQAQYFSHLLHARRVKCEPLVVKRFQRLANHLAFDGHIFLEDAPGDLDRAFNRPFSTMPLAPGDTDGTANP